MSSGGSASAVSKWLLARESEGLRVLQTLSGMAYTNCLAALRVLSAVARGDLVSFEELEAVAVDAERAGELRLVSEALAEFTGEPWLDCRRFFEVLLACQRAGYDLETVSGLIRGRVDPEDD